MAVGSEVVVAMCKQIIPSAVVQRVVHTLIKFLANKNVKAVEILRKLRG